MTRAFAGVTTAFAAATVAVLLSACGFQLRGDPALGLKALQVSSVGPSAVATDIRRALQGDRTRAAAAAPAVTTHLRVLSESREKQVHTITGTGRVYEFELRLAVRYEVVIPGRDLPLIEPTQVETRRLITYSETAPIAKEAEEQLLFKDMQVELAGRIMRQIAVAQREL